MAESMKTPWAQVVHRAETPSIDYDFDDDPGTGVYGMLINLHFNDRGWNAPVIEIDDMGRLKPSDVVASLRALADQIEKA